MAEDMLELGLEASNTLAGNDRLHNMYSSVKQRVRGGSSDEEQDGYRDREDAYNGKGQVGERRQPRYEGQLQPYGQGRDGYRESERDGHRRERSRRGSHHRSPAPSPTRSKNPRMDAVRDRFSSSDHGYAASAIGAIAGAFVAGEVVKGPRSPLATIAGAIVGGLGANALDNQYERKKEQGKEERELRRERRRSRDERGYGR